MKKTDQKYTPFDKQWEIEMTKLPKAFIIAMVKNKSVENEILRSKSLPADIISFSNAGGSLHELKIKQEYAEKYYKGTKQWELRKNDRKFKIDDFIMFTIIETGAKYVRQIIDVFEGGKYGLSEDYCILTLSGYRYSL